MDAKLWGDMTPEEKGALLLAYREGKVIEWCYGFRSPNTFVVDGSSSSVGMAPQWSETCAYRVEPEPKQPREFWLVGSTILPTKNRADSYRSFLSIAAEVIHVREVLK